MHFAFTEDQLAITDAVRTMLIETCTPADLRKLLESGAARDDARWATIREMGLPGLMAPEAAGGLGMGLIDSSALPKRRVMSPCPSRWSNWPASPFRCSRGWRTIAAGWKRPSAASSSRSVIRPTASSPTPIRPMRCCWATAMTLHLVARDRGHARAAGKLRCFPPPVHCRAGRPRPRRLSAAAGAQTAERGAVLAAAQMIGLGQRCIDLAVAYAKDRTQFGKPIGSYQAVKHLVANAQVQIEFARPVVHAAAAELPLGTSASQRARRPCQDRRRGSRRPRRAHRRAGVRRDGHDLGSRCPFLPQAGAGAEGDLGHGGAAHPHGDGPGHGRANRAGCDLRQRTALGAAA